MRNIFRWLRRPATAPEWPRYRDSVLILGTLGLSGPLALALEGSTLDETGSPVRIEAHSNPGYIRDNVFGVYSGGPERSIPRAIVSFTTMQALYRGAQAVDVPDGTVEACFGIGDPIPPIVRLTGEETLEQQLKAVEALGVISSPNTVER
jgi:hypothetical protein